MYDYKAIAVFVSVVECGSMQAAAEKLAMTPSAVTQTIQKLESSLKFKLLNRTTRRLYLTDLGEIFYQHVQHLPKSVENALKSVDNVRSQPIGELNIACPSGFIGSSLFESFRQVLDECPEFRLNLFFEDNLQDLADQKIDIALRSGTSGLSDEMIARHLFDVEWAIVANPSYFAQRQIPNTLTELAQLDWIAFSAKRLPQLTFSNDSEQMSIEPNYRITANSLNVSRSLTLSGLGIAIQPVVDVYHEIEQGNLMVLQREWKLPSTPFYLVTLQRIQSEKVRIGCELLMEFFTQKAVLHL
jgi:DNA-binding transcriptional LysR family regulator